MSAPANRLAVDIGGTFTDTVLSDHSGRVAASIKTLTTHADPADGAFAGIEHALGAAGIGLPQVTGFIHGTTLATNALIERRGTPVATVTNAGFRGILEIAYERRYSQYDIDIEKPDYLVPRARRFTIAGRMDVGGHELSPLDARAIPALAEAISQSGAGAVAICLLHAYANPEHERRLAEGLGAALPGGAICLSHEVSPEAREFDRLCTTIANAYIQPLMDRYLARLEAGLAAKGLGCPILMMTAAGGMTTVQTARRFPVRLVESGPAGGAILAARVAAGIGADRVLSFDMGGTTAKLCLIDDCRPQTARAFEIGRADRFIRGSGMPVRIPVVEMIEIGAGGGSIAAVDRLGRLTVGPRSAGSEPGPAAFGRGGQDATVTDADVAQGLIDPARFAEGRLKVDSLAACAAIDRAVGAGLGMQTAPAARGVSEIVDENMASAARMHAAESGTELGDRVMIAFGGNGPLHATRVARRAGVGRIVIPPDPGVGSAVGFLHAPVAFEIVRSRYALLSEMPADDFGAFVEAMVDEARGIVAQGAPGRPLCAARSALMRYRGQGHEIGIALPDRQLVDADKPALAQAFEAEYARIFSRAVPGMPIEILNWMVRVATPGEPASRTPEPEAGAWAQTTETRAIICDVTGVSVDAGVFDRAALGVGARVNGPALIIEPQTTTLVSADFAAMADETGNLHLTRKDAP